MLTIWNTFQSTPSRGGRPPTPITETIMKSFNPRPHAEGDEFGCKCRSIFTEFQSTPSRGGRQTSDSFGAVCEGFNPRPHAEGDVPVLCVCMPTNGFNPRPHAEGDFNSAVRFPSVGCFNPRPHAEGDNLRQLRRGVRSVSIHALTRRATLLNRFNF